MKENSKKELSFFQANLILNTPNKNNKNILWRLAHEKTRLRPDMVKERELLSGDRCLLSSSRRMFELLFSDIFVVGERNAVNMLLALPLFVDDKNKVWAGQKKFYEYPLALYYNVEKPWLGNA